MFLLFKAFLIQKLSCFLLSFQENLFQMNLSKSDKRKKKEFATCWFSVKDFHSVLDLKEQF